MWQRSNREEESVTRLFTSALIRESSRDRDFLLSEIIEQERCRLVI